MTSKKKVLTEKQKLLKVKKLYEAQLKKYKEEKKKLTEENVGLDVSDFSQMSVSEQLKWISSFIDNIHYELHHEIESLYQTDQQRGLIKILDTGVSNVTTGLQTLTKIASRLN